MFHTACPHCHLVIEESRRKLNPVICNSCGHVVSGKESEVESKLESSYLKSIVVISALMVMGFVQVASWGEHALEIIPLKLSEMSGQASIESKERMAEIALSLKKYDMVERLYAETARPGDSLKLSRLGKFQMSRSKYREAGETFRVLLAGDASNLDARYNFARCLGETGQIDEAAKHYDYILNSKPGVLQVTVVESYVKHLLAAGRLEDAAKVIQKTQARGTSVSHFMSTELKTIVERIRARG